MVSEVTQMCEGTRFCGKGAGSGIVGHSPMAAFVLAEIAGKRRELVGRKRFREQVTLNQIAAGLLQAAQLRVGFDAFRDHVDAEDATHRHDRCDQPEIGVAALEVADERAVDLQHVEPEAPQIAERRETRAEIVERHAHAEAAQFRSGTRARASWSAISTLSVISTDIRCARTCAYAFDQGRECRSRAAAVDR